MFNKKFIHISLELILIFTIVILMKTSPTVLSFRHWIMLFFLIYIKVLSKNIKLPNIIQTLKQNKLSEIFKYSILPSAIIYVFILLINQNFPTLMINTTKMVDLKPFPQWFALILYPLFSVPLQEIIFRWFYLSRLKDANLPNNYVIIIGALVFGIVHLPFGSIALTISTFIAGLWWNWQYLRSQKMLGPIISHAILGNLLIQIAIFSH